MTSFRTWMRGIGRFAPGICRLLEWMWRLDKYWDPVRPSQIQRHWGGRHTHLRTAVKNQMKMVKLEHIRREKQNQAMSEIHNFCFVPWGQLYVILFVLFMQNTPDIKHNATLISISVPWECSETRPCYVAFTMQYFDHFPFRAGVRNVVCFVLCQVSSTWSSVLHFTLSWPSSHTMRLSLENSADIQLSLLWVVTICRAHVCWFKAGCHVCSPRAVTLNRPDLQRKTRETAYNLFNLVKQCHDVSKLVWHWLWQVPWGTQIDTAIVAVSTAVCVSMATKHSCHYACLSWSSISGCLRLRFVRLMFVKAFMLCSPSRVVQGCHHSLLMLWKPGGLHALMFIMVVILKGQFTQ